RPGEWGEMPGLGVTGLSGKRGRAPPSRIRVGSPPSAKRVAVFPPNAIHAVSRIVTSLAFLPISYIVVSRLGVAGVDLTRAPQTRTLARGCAPPSPMTIPVAG